MTSYLLTLNYVPLFVTCFLERLGLGGVTSWDFHNLDARREQENTSLLQSALNNILLYILQSLEL